MDHKPMSQPLSHAAHLPPASTRLSSGARLALTAAILLALAACTMSSVFLVELLRARAPAADVPDDPNDPLQRRGPLDRKAGDSLQRHHKNTQRAHDSFPGQCAPQHHGAGAVVSTRADGG